MTRPEAGTVLVVDDDEDVRQALGDVVGLTGRRAVTAEHGLAALAALASVRPCLILLDLVMPRMDGWQLLAAIRRDAALAAIPVVVVSAHAGNHLPAGANGLLRKPVDLYELRRAMVEHCPLA